MDIEQKQKDMKDFLDKHMKIVNSNYYVIFRLVLEILWANIDKIKHNPYGIASFIFECEDLKIEIEKGQISVLKCNSSSYDNRYTLFDDHEKCISNLCEYLANKENVIKYQEKIRIQEGFIDILRSNRGN